MGASNGRLSDSSTMRGQNSSFSVDSEYATSDVSTSVDSSSQSQSWLRGRRKKLRAFTGFYKGKKKTGQLCSCDSASVCRCGIQDLEVKRGASDEEAVPNWEDMMEELSELEHAWKQEAVSDNFIETLSCRQMDNRGRPIRRRAPINIVNGTGGSQRRCPVNEARDKHASSGGVSTSGSEDHSGSDGPAQHPHPHPHPHHSHLSVHHPAYISQSQRDLPQQRRLAATSNGALESGSIQELRQMRLNGRRGAPRSPAQRDHCRKMPCSPNQHHCPSRDPADECRRVADRTGALASSRGRDEETEDSANEWNLVDARGQSDRHGRPTCQQASNGDVSGQGHVGRSESALQVNGRNNNASSVNNLNSPINARSGSNSLNNVNSPMSGRNIVSSVNSVNSPMNIRNGSRNGLSVKPGPTQNGVRGSHRTSAAAASGSEQRIVIQAEFHQENGSDYVSLRPSLAPKLSRPSPIAASGKGTPYPAAAAARHSGRAGMNSPYPGSLSHADGSSSPREPDAFLWEYGDSDTDDAWSRPPDMWPEVGPHPGGAGSIPYAPAYDGGCKIVMPNGDQLHVNYDQMTEEERKSLVLESGPWEVEDSEGAPPEAREREGAPPNGRLANGRLAKGFHSERHLAASRESLRNGHCEARRGDPESLRNGHCEARRGDPESLRNGHCEARRGDPESLRNGHCETRRGDPESLRNGHHEARRGEPESLRNGHHEARRGEPESLRNGHCEARRGESESVIAEARSSRRNRSRTRRDAPPSPRALLDPPPTTHRTETSSSGRLESAGRARAMRATRRQRSASRSLSRSRRCLSTDSSSSDGRPPSLVRPDTGQQAMKAAAAATAARGSNKRRSTACYFRQLTDAVVVRVLSHLASDELCVAGRTCHRWQRLMWHPHLWSSIVIRDRRIDLDRALEVLTNRLMQATPNVCLTVDRITFSCCDRLTDSGLALVAARCPELRQLTIIGCKTISNAAMYQLVTRCDVLERLNVTGCSAVSHLSPPDGDTASLQPGKQIYLTNLDMTDCYLLDDAGLKTIALHCQQLTRLYLRRCTRLTDVGVQHVAMNCCMLREISLCDCHRLTDFTLRELSKLGSNLRYLSMAKCEKVSDVGVEYIARHCAKLRYLNVRGCEAVSDHGLLTLANNCPRLRSLDIGKCDVTDAGVEALAQRCPALRKLSIRACGLVTDKGVILLAYYCRALLQLNIQECNLSADAYKTVKRFCKQCLIEHTNPAFY